VSEVDFQNAVNSFYEGLYRFAYSLTGNSDDACELTQETFARFLARHGQIRDHGKIKSWLSTTLYRTFLGWKRQEASHPHVELSLVEDELPALSPAALDKLESEIVNEVLLQVEERYRVPLALFYFEQLSYSEISGVLEIPVGTVMSRLSRGKELLRKSLMRTVISDDGPKTFPDRSFHN
jgi:RNA polymerase sigma factor (sigma-70 family)